MTAGSTENLPAEAVIAIAHTPPELRGALTILFELDQRLARIVAATTEPMLGQMRIAWWRDVLAKPAPDRPAGDAVLDGIGAHWMGRERALLDLVDGWEHMLAPPPLGEADAEALISARCEAILAVFGVHDGDTTTSFEAAARVWAIADVTAKVSHPEERALMLRLWQRQPALSERLPRKARGLAVLGALGARALKRGGRPMMEGRAASLIATRAAILGR
ncbi:hypothetical protein [Qipengyuania sp. ASV99]|uniref:hypothetical protein n=1 Tax=Qipengyuania sp. ASV99 TaxID=3399681 RepID=UPI003A4C831E